VGEVLAVGLCTVDVVYAVDRPPGPDEKVVARSQQIAAGGPATGAAVTVAALGGASTLVTALGRHPLAAFAAGEVGSRGVVVLDAAPDRTDPPALSSAVVAADGRRSVVSVNAAGSRVEPPSELTTLARGAAALLIDGHHADLALAAAAGAAAGRRPVVLDGGSWKPALADLLPLVDIAVCSAVFRAPGAGSVEESAAILRDAHRVPFVAVTAGPAPVRWWSRQGSGEVRVPTVHAVDTLGAGDAFHGAVAYAVANSCPGSPVPEEAAVAALEYAAEVAVIRCQTAGPRAWLADPRLTRLSAREG
jgi:sugar/nucleoside kinase (ribokinase family)